MTEGEDKRGDEYSLDLSEKPYSIDLNIKKIRQNKNDQPETDSIRFGIFKFEKDELILCINERENGTRPDEFVSEPGNSPNDLLIRATRMNNK